jgi:glycosyltransferase 2 family protein
VTAPADRRGLLRLARLAYLALLLGVAGWVVATRGDDALAIVRTARPELLLLCLLASFGQIALTSAVWSSGLRALGAPVPWTRSLAATAQSGPARYLPGSVWYAVGRAAVLQREGVPVRALAAVATLETLLAPVVAFALGGTLLVLTGTAVGGSLPLPLLLTGVALLGLASPPVVNAALRVRAGDAAPLRLGWPGLLRLLGWQLLFWLWSGSVFALYVSAFPDAVDRSAAAVVGAYAVAWGVGWLAVFAPQGIGVSEVVLAALLAGGGAGLALVLGGYRALIAVRDLSAAALALVLARRTAAAPPG